MNSADESAAPTCIEWVGGTMDLMNFADKMYYKKAWHGTHLTILFEKSNAKTCCNLF